MKFSAVKDGLFDYGVRETLEGLVEEFWTDTEFDDVYYYATNGVGLEALGENVISNIRRSLKNPKVLKSVQKITYQDVINWMNEANPKLLAQCLQVKDTAMWLGRVWGQIQWLVQEAQNQAAEVGDWVKVDPK